MIDSWARPAWRVAFQAVWFANGCPSPFSPLLRVRRVGRGSLATAGRRDLQPRAARGGGSKRSCKPGCATCASWREDPSRRADRTACRPRFAAWPIARQYSSPSTSARAPPRSDRERRLLRRLRSAGQRRQTQHGTRLAERSFGPRPPSRSWSHPLDFFNDQKARDASRIRPVVHGH
jgi:hypothetical protein